MKALYIISLIVTVAFGITDVYYINLYQEVWIEFLFSDWTSTYGYYGDPGPQLHQITTEGASICLLFIAFYIITFSFTLAKIKRTTAKVMSIIGVSIAGIFFLITLMPIADPGKISFSELGSGLIILILIMLAFCIVNLVQAVRNEQPKLSNQHTIDDLV